MSARELCNAMESAALVTLGPDGLREAIYGKERWRDTLPAAEVVWEEVS